MSLWTPGGEHEVPRQPPADQPAAAAPGSIDEAILAALSPEDRARLEAMPPEERARAEAAIREQIAQMAAVQQQMAEAPAAMVIANHAMGLYELATIHLRQDPPNFDEAKLAIDAFAAVVGSLEGHLGPDEAALRDGLAQIRLAFVQMQAAAGGTEGDAGDPG